MKKIDVSIICFALVMAAAIPVASLRARTYNLGYELGKLKKEERDLRQKNALLQSELASTQRKIRDKTDDDQGKNLSLPDVKEVIYAK